MSDDLISRKELIKTLSLKFSGLNDATDLYHGGKFDAFKEIQRIIKQQPIAYDKEAVVEQLENELELAEKQKEECTFKALPYYDRTEGYIVAMSNAISIVKVGGIDG